MTLRLPPTHAWLWIVGPAMGRRRGTPPCSGMSRSAEVSELNPLIGESVTDSSSPRGDQQTLDSLSTVRNSSRSSPVRMSTAPSVISGLSPAPSTRRTASCAPSADQQASTTFSTSLRASPPTRGCRYALRRSPSERRKRTLSPSGENFGAVSRPSVSACSPPVSICLIQIRSRPSRPERKARKRPSGDADGDTSSPE